MNAPMTQDEHRQKLPLCVDLDGTLIYTDLLFEAFLLLLRKDFFAALRVPLWLLRDGKAATKLRIAERAALYLCWIDCQLTVRNRVTGSSL